MYNAIGYHASRWERGAFLQGSCGGEDGRVKRGREDRGRGGKEGGGALAASLPLGLLTAGDSKSWIPDLQFPGTVGFGVRRLLGCYTHWMGVV